MYNIMMQKWAGEKKYGCMFGTEFHAEIMPGQFVTNFHAEHASLCMRHTWYLVPYTKEPLIAIAIAIAGKNVQGQPSRGAQCKQSN